MLCLKDIRDLHSTLHVSNEEPGAERGAVTFPKLHSKSVQSWAQSSRLPFPGQGSFLSYRSLQSNLGHLAYWPLCPYFTKGNIMTEKKGKRSLEVPALP